MVFFFFSNTEIMPSSLFAFLVAASFVLVTPLCTPDEWEGSQTSILAYANGTTHGQVEQYMHVSYDYTHRRSSTFSQTFFQGVWSFHQTIILFNETTDEGHMYVVDLVTDECFVTEIPGPFRRTCIPAGSIFAGNFSLGLEHTYNVSSYYAYGYMISSNIIVADSPHGIVPVIEILQGRLGEHDGVKTFTFRDITLGIESDKVFNPPTKCSENATRFTEAPFSNRGQYFMAL